MARLLLVGLAATSAAAQHTCVDARNTQDSEYSVQLAIGSSGHTMRVAPDTGSYQLVLASKGCKGCEGHCMGCPQHKLFDSANSSSYVNLHELVLSAYGQGQVVCEVGADYVTLGALRTLRPQVSQLIKGNQLQGFSQDSSYDGIMGLGVTDYVPVSNTTQTPSTLNNLNVTTFGICFSLKSGEGGRLDLNGGVPGLPYHDVPGVGVGYWMIALHSWEVGKKNVGCDTAPHCLAIIDSGTTLVGLPNDMLTKTLNQIGTINQDCSNVDELPTITIQVAGYTLTLPPSAYVAQLNDLTQTQPVKVGPFVANLPVGTESACTHLFFESGIAESKSQAPVLLIGMPIFRRYAIRFDRGVGNNGLVSAPGHKLGFSPLDYDAPTCSSCGATVAPPDTGALSPFLPGESGAALAGAGAPGSLQPLSDGAEAAPKKVSHRERIHTYSAKKLRFPGWASELHRDSQGRYWI